MIHYFSCEQFNKHQLEKFRKFLSDNEISFVESKNVCDDGHWIIIRNINDVNLILLRFEFTVYRGNRPTADPAPHECENGSMYYHPKYIISDGGVDVCGGYSSD